MLMVLHEHLRNLAFSECQKIAFWVFFCLSVVLISAVSAQESRLLGVKRSCSFDFLVTTKTQDSSVTETTQTPAVWPPVISLLV